MSLESGDEKSKKLEGFQSVSQIAVVLFVPLLRRTPSGAAPAKISGAIEFGLDSAYFALGDQQTGQDLVDIVTLNNPDYHDSFEFFLPHIQTQGFMMTWFSVPPSDRPVLAINTNRDGGLKAVWAADQDGYLSGILTDITGRKSDQVYLDTLLKARRRPAQKHGTGS